MRRMIGQETRVNARTSRRYAARGAVAALVATLLPLAPLCAQAGLTRTEDAAPLPRGVARLRVVPSWSRFETRFGGAQGGPSTVPLASVLAADSLGVAQIPGLAPAEQALRTLTGDPSFRLSLGRSVSHATARVVTTAFAAEYGLTRRITLGAVLPFVQSRTELFVALNPEGHATANVGPNPGRIVEAERDRAVALQVQLESTRARLQDLLNACVQNPAADPSCPTILANRTDVESLIAETGAFGSALAVLFGTSANSATQPFAALTETTAADAIGNHLSTIKERLRAYVGSTADQIVAGVPLAVGPAAFGDLQQLLLAREFGLAPDSLGQVYRINIGDIELGAKFLVSESGRWTATPERPAPSLRTRLSLQTIVRLGTGSPTHPRLPHRYLEYGTGDGQTDLEAAVLFDLGLGRGMLVTAAARYTAQLGQVEAGRIPDENGVVNPFTPLHDGTRTLGDILVAELTPRFLVGRYFGADAHYVLIRRGDDEYSATDGGAPLRRGGFTEQRVGVGISYSTLRGAGARVPRLPVEVSVAHIETISGSSGLVPRASRNQIELRLYYRLRR